MDVVSVFERRIEIQLGSLPPVAPPALARVVDHLLDRVAWPDHTTAADSSLSDLAQGSVNGCADPAVEDSLAQGESGMELGLRAFEAAERLRGVVDAAQLGALTRLHASAQAVFDGAAAQAWVGRTPFTVHEMVVMEVSAATGIGAGEAGTRLDLAIGPESRLGFLRDAVASGLTTLRRACRLVDATRSLGHGQADTVARATLAPTRDAAGLSDALFSQRLRRAVLTVDEEREASRKRARARIGAFAQIFDDGTGTLTIINDAEKIAAAIDRADCAARAARAGGDPRTLDQLRADFFTDAAIFGWPDGRGSFGAVRRQPAGDVRIVIPFSTLFGFDDAPCELPGHGWVSARHAREIAAAEESTWQALVADVDTGRALALSRQGYRPSAEMLDHVRAVDGICRGPGCQVRADRCDLDHDIAWPAGATSVSNLSCKDRWHHRARTTGLWKAVRHLDDTIEWRTAAGRRYVTYPYDWRGGPDGVKPNESASSVDRPHQPDQPDPSGPPDRPPIPPVRPSSMNRRPAVEPGRPPFYRSARRHRAVAGRVTRRMKHCAARLRTCTCATSGSSNNLLNTASTFSPAAVTLMPR